jgi:RNA polymerase sigma-70 factor (ECF subfamily)
MTPSITPSIFATPILSRLGWHGWLKNERFHMIQENSKLKATPNTATSDVDAKQLLERVAKQDVNALSELYEAHAGLLMSVIFAVLKDKAESEDILQESFLSIWNKAEMYQPHLGKPTSWMVTIAKNKAYDRYRKLVRRSEGMIVLRDSMLDVPVIKTVESNTDNEELLEGFSELNADQREAIELVFYQGYTQQEAADKLDAPLGTIKARIRRGLIQLKEFLNNDSPNNLT